MVLLDEIDKADSDVPNALLEVFANRSFSVPGQGEIHALTSHLPLTIITTNEDRELPPAFVHAPKLQPEPVQTFQDVSKFISDV